jgi:ABC-type nitrate/sulfonate/bicarbonate transport system, permease component
MSAANFLMKTFLISLSKKIIPIMLWLVIWQAIAFVLNKTIILPTPIKTAAALWRLCKTEEFWLSLFNSFSKILLFALPIAIVIGVALAILAYKSKIIKAMISPAIGVLNSIPVASFIILALVWIGGSALSTFVSVMMVVPIIYNNILAGLIAVPEEYIEVADVFGKTKAEKIRLVYLPTVLPSFATAIRVGIGFAWKSGISAEILGFPQHTIGGHISDAKNYLLTDDLFAWTAMLIILSMLFERICIFALKRVEERKYF